MNDAAQTLFIMHSNGQSYIELGKEGTIDMYSTNSVNIRTQGDLNLHADRDINMNAGRDLNIFGKNTHIESQENTTHFTGKAMNTTVLGTHTHHIGGSYSVLAGNDVGLSATLGSVYLKGGPMIMMNSGICPTVPLPASQLPRVLHTDTLYDSNVGYAAAPQKLSSIVSRAPAHAPWAAAGKGVDATADLNSGNAVASVPSPIVTQVNSTVPPSPINPTNETLVATVPTTSQVASSGSIDPATTSAMVSQMAVTASTGPAGEAIQQSAAVVDTGTNKQIVIGSLGLTPQQLVTAGYLKPGSDIAVQASINAGQSIEQSMTPNFFTGKDGINSLADLVGNTLVQTNIASTLLNKAKDTLVNQGVITGKEAISQTGGLIMSTAVAGLKPTLQYAGNAAKSLIQGDTAGFTKNISAIGDNISGTINNVEDKISSTVSNIENNISTTVSNLENSIENGISNAYDNISSSIDDLMSGGLFASLDVEERLNSTKVDSFLKGLQDNTAGAFNQVISAFRALEPNVPISLSAANDGLQAELTAADLPPANPTTYADASNILNKQSSNQGFVNSVVLVMDLAKGTDISTVSSDVSNNSNINQLVTTSGGTPSDTPVTLSVASNDAVVGGVAGGLTAISNVVTNGQTPVQSIPGTGPVSTLVTNVSGAIGTTQSFVSSIQGVATKLQSSGLLSMASSGLNKAGLSQLSGVLGSLGLGGPFKTSLPTMATATNKIAAVEAQSRRLLGDPKIPPINLTGKSTATVSTAQIEAKNKQVSQLNAAVEKQQQAKDKWATARDMNGDTDPATLQAHAEYVQATQQVDSLTA